MDGHFRAFSFVDQITALEGGASIHGRYAIPPAVDTFPVSLVAEAVGQLAAWAAMSAVNFTHRPVAGIAGEVEFLSEARPGQVLELAACLESVDTDTAGYGGTASVAGRPVLRLRDCVGPMLPAEEFDDPQALRARFALLRAGGAEPGAFPGVPGPDLEPGPDEPGCVARAVLRVPREAHFFSDHFPRRKVFPGTLLTQASLQVAARLASRAAPPGGAPWMPRSIADVKLRTFIPPGETLQLEARPTAQPGSSLEVGVETRSGPRLIGSAKVRFARGEAP